VGGARLRLIFASLTVGLLVAELDQWVFSTALPTVVGELGGLRQLPLITTAYLLAATASMPFYGRLGDLFGRRKVIAAALLIFLLGSVIGGLAPDVDTLIIARFVQGLGAGGLLILIQAVVADLIMVRRRALYLTALDAVYAAAAVAGPLIGGWLTQGIGWRWAFWLNLPVGAAAVLATVLVLPDDPMLGSAQRVPILPLRNWFDRNLLVAVVTGAVLGFAVFGLIGYLPIYLQMVTGLTPLGAGAVLLSLVAGLGIATVFSAQLIARTGRLRGLPVAGSAIVAVGLIGMWTLSPTSDVAAIGLWLLIIGIGLGCAWETLVVVAQNGVPGAYVGTATAVNGFGRELGVLAGTAAIGALFVSRFDRLVATSLPAGTVPVTVTPLGLAAQPAEVRQGIVTAYHDALAPIFLALVPVVLIAAVVSGLLRPARRRDQLPTEDRIEIEGVR
jgi:predicted MFS family arabinose efflux permease